MRVTAPCQMKSGKFTTVTLTCRTDKYQCRSLNHTLDYLDSIKINSAIKVAVGKEVAKGHAPSPVSRNLQRVGDLEGLKDAGGTHLTLKAVHNAGKDFKKSNPDVQIIGAKEDWEDQTNTCFDALQALGEEVLSAKGRVSRIIDKQWSHGIVSATRCKLSDLLYSELWKSFSF